MTKAESQKKYRDNNKDKLSNYHKDGLERKLNKLKLIEAIVNDKGKF